MSHSAYTWLLVVALGCALSARTGVSASAGPLRGTVRDANGGAVAGATVSVLTAHRSVVQSVTTDADGRFAVAGLATGHYLVAVVVPHFAPHAVAVDVPVRDELRIVLDPAPVREEVTVTATPGDTEDRRVAPQAINIIGGEAIAARARTVVGQAFEEEVGLSLQRTSPTIAGVFVRGLTGNKVNVFVDGVRYSTGAARGGINTFLDLIDPSGLDSIEVLRGPGSAEYGSDALGGSVQFLSKVPLLAASDDPRWGGQVGLAADSAHPTARGNASASYTRRSFAAFGSVAGQRVGELRPGGGFDSHAAVSRFLGVRSDVLMPARLPDTGFAQAAAWLRSMWRPAPAAHVTASYALTRQDGGKRYDQLLGGDGNLIADLNDLGLDLFYVRFERLGMRWFDHGSVTYSLNRQREERVNQGGNGNPRATIGHEPEQTIAHGFQGSVSRQLSARHAIAIGGDAYLERLTSPAFNVNPVTGVESPRRPRVPDGATYRTGGLYARSTLDLRPDRLRLVGSVRWSAARYDARASASPRVNGQPLWPDDALGASSGAFRAALVTTPDDRWSMAFSVSRGFRAPHATDLGTLGLTGAGFEVAAPDLAGRGATVGTTADAFAVSSGRPVRQVGPETSRSYDGSVRYRTSRLRAELSTFINLVRDNIQKQALILPAGAVGQTLGGQPIVEQLPTGAVLVAASPSPVLVRANFDNARIWGVELDVNARLTSTLRATLLHTFVRAEDTVTGRPPNIEGGTPAPNGFVSVQFSPPAGRWWIEPYARAAARQDHLSTLDLEDRRTGATRSRAAIRSFFLNGATARGWVQPGPDGASGTSDDVLTATGETLGQIQDRVLGRGVAAAPLFSAVPGYLIVGLRGGFTLARHEVLIDVGNLGDRNYRGISWGVDAPGRGISVRYVARF